MSDLHNPLVDESDYERYDALLADFLGGRLDSARFIAERLLLGIYGERQEGLCMVRTKIPGGRLPTAYLSGYASALETYSQQDAVHLTTRGDIQFYDVPLAQTGAMQRHLGRAGIATREAGGNTVRNVTACPLAGVCPAEHTDVDVHVQAISRWFVRHPLTESMPRKFKIAVSGCGADCAQAAANDLGIIATELDGRRGYRLLVGGGLGAKPRAPVELESFIKEEALLPSIEAVLALHDRYSDRARKARSRIKFLVEDWGPEQLRARYAQEAARTRAAFDATHAARAPWHTPRAAPPGLPDAPRTPFAQRQNGLWAVPVAVKNGDLNAAQLRGLHTLLTRLGLDHVRVTTDQNLLVPHVPEDRRAELLTGLAALGLGLPRPGDNVVVCPGTRSCQLGITASQRVAALLDGGASDLRVRVNGCQNSCARSDLADVGLFGKARRHFGRLVPTYALQLGGGHLGLGVAGPEIPAARVPEAVTRLHDAFAADIATDFGAWVRGKDAAYFESLLHDLMEVHEEDLPALCTDHGEKALFRVTAAGVGECAGVQLSPVEKILLELRYERRVRQAFEAKRKLEDACEPLAAQLELGARLLLLSARLPDVAAPQALAALREQLPAEPLAAAAAALEARLAHWRAAPDEQHWPELMHAVDAWIDEVRAFRRTRASHTSRLDQVMAAI